MQSNASETLQKDYKKNSGGSYEGMQSSQGSEGQYYATNPLNTNPWISNLIERNVPQKTELFVKPVPMNNDPPKISVFRNPQTFIPEINTPKNVHSIGQLNVKPLFYDSNSLNQRYAKDIQQPTYEYHIKSDGVPLPSMKSAVDTSNKNFITACSARRKNEN